MATRREDLLQQLDVKLAMLIKRHDDLMRYKQMADALKEENELLKQQYATLKLAKTLAMGESDVHKAKVQLSRLIRKIDVCISLLLPESK
ncbi:MAG: hypothetical protein SOW56_06365 [Bacteroidaceae bacterium]|nr:hypothetical protein [Prevotellaceae bacterium]MDY3063633.1 hypothetical protein [Bacteroidaceae bacterium]